jgi:hypothetical protein
MAMLAAAGGGHHGGASPVAAAALSPYNAFIRDEMRRLRVENPQLDHRTALRMAANNVRLLSLRIRRCRQ